MEKINQSNDIIPQFSIIIPTFNNLELLKRALISIEQQTEKNYETIVVVDGSEDGTIEYLKKYEKKKINLKFFFIAASGGPAKPRNFGIRQSTGEWLCFLDSDDEWLPNKLEEIKKSIKTQKFDILYHLEISKNNTKEKIINKKGYSGNFYKNLLLNGNICSSSGTIVKSKFVKDKNITFLENNRFISAEDFSFWLDAAKKGATFFHLKKILGIYHIHKNSLSSDIYWHKKNVLRLIFYHIFIINNNIEFKKIWKKIMLLYKFDILVIQFFFKSRFTYLGKLIIYISKNPKVLLLYMKRKFS